MSDLSDSLPVPVPPLFLSDERGSYEGDDNVCVAPKKTKFHVSVCSVILVASLLSTVASIAGGLIMYLQGVEALEDSVRETSAGELSFLKDKVRGKLTKVEEAADTLKRIVYSKERVSTGNVSEWSSLVRSITFAQVSSQAELYDSTVQLETFNQNDSSGFYAGVWGDVLRNGSQELVFGVYGDHLPEKMFTVTNGTGVMTVPSYKIGRDTGELQEFVYDWELTGRGMGVPGVSNEHYVWGTPPGDAIAARWWKPRRWYASDQNLYSYAEFQAFFVPPPPPHPWHGYKHMSVWVGFLFKSFQPPFDTYRLEHPDTTVLLVDRRTEIIYASTEGPMIPDWCQPSESKVITQINELNLRCSFSVGNLSASLREAFSKSADMKFGSFAKKTCKGTEIFMSRIHSHEDLELLWMRPVSSVQGKVNAAILYLVVFSVLVLLIDITIAGVELVFIALPMKQLSLAISNVASMDTESASAVIENLPIRITEMKLMRNATRHLVSNMVEYKSFLPQVIFNVDHEHFNPLLKRDPPGVENGEAAVVFTDIEGSTYLWEHSLEGMKTALEMHNFTIRACIVEWNGYEVKTIGDAFMVTFDSMHAGVGFGLFVQEELAKVAWPESLAADGHVIRVRIGVHYGPINTEIDATGRADYLGPTVNRAARIQSWCAGGAVSVATSRATSQDCHGALEVPLGDRTLKGIAEPVHITLLIPTSLSERAETILEVEKLPRTNSASLSASGHSATSSAQRRANGAQRTSALVHISGTLRSIDSATVASIVHDVDEQLPRTATAMLNSFVTTAVSCLGRTDGVIATVVGAYVIAGWNATKKCVSHVESCFRCVGLIIRSQQIRCGVCTGGVLSGYVGTQDQRFITATGATHCSLALSQLTGDDRPFLYTSRDTHMVSMLKRSGYLYRPFAQRVCKRDEQVFSVDIGCLQEGDRLLLTMQGRLEESQVVPYMTVGTFETLSSENTDSPNGK